MYFEIIVYNDHYPLSYKCESLREAYGCMEALASGLLADIPKGINLDEIMEDLVRMKNGSFLRTGNAWYLISIHKDEA